MAEPQAPEILSLAEVREVRAAAHNYRLGHPVPRLCATVEHWHAQAEANWSCYEDAQEAQTNALQRVEEVAAERDRLNKSAAGHEEGYYLACQERDRLRALVGRMREALEGAQSLKVGRPESSDDPVIKALAEMVRDVLSDPDGQRAAEELRLLRAWEAAVRDRASNGNQDAQILAERAAWTALTDFREVAHA
jgi:hypothetical protein